MWPYNTDLLMANDAGEILPRGIRGWSDPRPLEHGQHTTTIIALVI